MIRSLITSEDARTEVRRLCAAALKALVAGKGRLADEIRARAERWNDIANLLAGEEEYRPFGF